MGLVRETELVSVNGRPLEDFLDWEFLTAEDAFMLRARLPSGEELECDIERPEGMPMGLTLEPPRIRRCANHCDFCFVDGNPTGLRANLYIRDDDYRLSFRYGNFATLTNLKPKDEARIVEYRLSPLYVSVHATDPVVRRWLLRNPEAPAIVPQLARFAEQGIRFHTQVVLIPGINDGAQLERTLGDLHGLGDAVLSVSVVPVALTEFSKHHLVAEPTAAQCRAALEAVERWAARGMAESAARSSISRRPHSGVARSFPMARFAAGGMSMEKSLATTSFRETPATSIPEGRLRRSSSAWLERASDTSRGTFAAGATTRTGCSATVTSSRSKDRRAICPMWTSVAQRHS